MLNIRQATEKDNPQILRLLKEIALYYEGLELKNFWVAEKEGKIIGTVQLQEINDFVFLGSLCVDPKEQHKGSASCLLHIATKNIIKPIYLYTIIPDFFKRHGFEITKPIPGLPSKARYECESCHSERCVTMIKHNK
jgi:N-acetylglutamate synthase-like GNAT family acetyltransferase